MRIVYICDFFHPDAGYHPNLLSKYWSTFGNEVFMITSEIEKMPASLTSFFDCNGIEEMDLQFEKNYGVKIIRCPIYCFVSGRSIYKPAIFKVIRELNPDVVYVNGNDTMIGMQLTLCYRCLPFGLVMDSHMLEIASTNSVSKRLFRFAYRKTLTRVILKNNIPVIRAQNDDYIEKNLGIPLSRCPWISFGSDLLLFHPDEESKNSAREEFGIGKAAFVALYAGKVNKTKGLDLLAEAIKQRFQTEKDLVFVVIGSSEGEQGAEIEDLLKQSENRIIRFPTQRYVDLPRFYQMADLAIFPRQCSLSFYDVQACGLPVVFEENSVNLDRSSAENAVVFAPGDASALRSKIELFIQMDDAEYANYRKNAIEFVQNTYNYEKKAREYIPYLEAQTKTKGRL